MLAWACGLPWELYLLLGLALLLARCVNGRRAALIALLGLGTAPLWFVKTSIGAGAFALMLSAMAISRVRGASWRGAVAGPFVHVVAAAAMGRLLIGTWAGLQHWAAGSSQVFSSFSAEMSFAPAVESLREGLAVGAVLLASMLFLILRRSRAAVQAALLLLPLFLAFKAGFVREDAHVAQFFAFSIGAAGLLLLEVEGRLIRPALLAGCAVMALALYTLHGRDLLDAAQMARTVTLQEGFRRLGYALEFRAYEARMAGDSVRGLSPDVLPQGVRDAIGGRTVAVIPWEASACPANHFNCVPLPTLQLYAAITPDLDRRTARLFLDREAPERVLIHSRNSIDERDVLLEAPFTTQALLRGYALEHLEQDNYVVLRKRETTLPEPAVFLGQPASLDTWIPVPDTGGDLAFVRLPVQLNLRGRLTRLLFRISPLMLHLRYESGLERGVRLVTGNAADGVLVGRVPVHMYEIANLFTGKLGDRVVAIHLAGPGMKFFKRELAIEWLRGGPAQRLAPAERAPLRINCDQPIDRLRFDVPSRAAVTLEGDTVRLAGWALAGGARATSLSVAVDGRFELPLRPMYRADVGRDVEQPCGFDTLLPREAFGPGAHSLRLRLSDARGRCRESPGALQLTVSPSARR